MSQRVIPSNLFGVSYACSPPFPSHESISEIKVETLNQYNSAYSSGGSLNQIILVRELNENYGVSIKEFINESKRRQSYDDGFFFTLTEAPSDTLKLAMKITITFESDRTYDATFDSIVITP